MTREEAIESLRGILTEAVEFENSVCYVTEEDREPLEMAIQALEQESCENWCGVPSDEMTLEQARQAVKNLRKKLIEHLDQGSCTDAISRQAVLDKKELVELEDGQSFYCISPEDVETLPPVTPQPKWIPVNEKLPEDEQEILFSTKTGRVHSGKYHDDGSANQWYSHKDKCRAWNNVVTAWMPLPAPYEPKESEEV